jgi:hypothetical protein
MGTYSDFQAFFLLSTTWYLVDWKPKSKPISSQTGAVEKDSREATGEGKYLTLLCCAREKFRNFYSSE